MKIDTKNLTKLELEFIESAIEGFNDLMFADELNHNIPTKSLKGVLGSLVKKKIIYTNDDYPNEFYFYNDNEEIPELIK